jgi:phosphomannomutase/phosphoglucomutase
VVVDAGHGCASQWAPQAFGAAGAQVVPLFCTPDGTFPDRSPNPARPEAVRAARQAVRDSGADLAACFDGDGDRAVFVDERGDYVPAEEVLILLARDRLAREPGAAVVYDQKCTHQVPLQIEAAGGRPVREKSGHTFIKARLLAEDAVLGGEISGHFFFRELGGDDGLYAALWVARMLAGSGRSLARMREAIPDYYVTGEMRVPCPPGHAHAIVGAVRAAFADRPQDDTDGVRVEFEDGWALCRPSVTEPVVTLAVEGYTPQARDRIRAALERIVRDAAAL